MPTNKQNFFLFYGPDDYSIRQKIENWKQEFSKKYTNSGIVDMLGTELEENELIGRLEEALSPSLFSQTKLVIAKACLPSKAAQEKLIDFWNKTIESPTACFVIIWQPTGVDKRLGFTKKLIANKNVKVTEFNLPHGREFTAWLQNKTIQMGSGISPAALEKLAVKLGRDLFEQKKFGGRVVETKEVFDLWTAAAELEKLTSYSKEIKEQDIDDLVTGKIGDPTFLLADEVLKNQGQKALNMLEVVFRNSSVDEKTTAIKILALLSEQARGLLLVTLLMKKNLTSERIAETLGWSSGRIFMIQKQLQSVSLNKLKPLLGKILSTDQKLKSSDISPKLLMASLIGS